MSKKLEGNHRLKHKLRIKTNNKFNNEHEQDKKDKFNTIKYYERQNNHEKALSLIEEYLVDYPEDYRILDYKAMILVKIKKIEEAKDLILSYYDNKDVSKRDHIFATFILARIYNFEGDIEKAKELYIEGISDSDNFELRSRVELSSIYCNEGDYNKAFDILEIPYFNIDYLNLQRAEIKYSMGNYRGAISSFNRKIICDEKDERNYVKVDEKIMLQEKYFMIGRCYSKLNDNENALKYLNMSLIDKNRDIYIKAIIIIIRIKVELCLLEDAISMGEEFLSMNNLLKEDETVIRKLLATAYSKRRRYEKAEELYKDVCDNKYEVYNYSKILISKGNIEEAEKLLSKVINLNNINYEDDYEGLYRYALTKLRLNKYDDFMKIYNVFELYDGTTENIERVIVFIKRMKLYLDVKNGKKIEDRDYSYSEKQIINYDRNYAIEHVIDNHVINPSVSYFKPDIDVNRLFDDIIPLLDKKYIHYHSFFDTYTIRYNDIGYDSDGPINEMMVITLPGTTDIITVYPSRGLDNFDVKEEDKVVKKHTKRLSQIDKFNLKYKNNNQ